MRAFTAATLTLALTLTAGLAATAATGDPTDDPYVAVQWGLHQVNAPDAWEASRGDDVVIAVVDTGVDLRHEDLADNMLLGNDFRNCGVNGCGTGDVLPDDSLMPWHGTHVAGIAAAVGGNGVGISGVAPNAKIMSLQGFIAGGGDSDLADAIRFAVDAGADVLNLSFGTDLYPIDLLDYAGAMELSRDAVAYAIDAGAVVVAAAGNFHQLCSSPALHDDVICVTSTWRDDDRSPWVNNPIKPDLLAVAGPGGEMDGTIRSNDWCDNEILSTVPTGWGWNSHCAGMEGETNYASLSGTSMAAPHVAGVAALLTGQGCTADEVREIIRTQSRTPVPTGDVHGVFTPLYGWGIVDAAAATSAAGDTCTPRGDTPTVDDVVVTVNGPTSIDLAALAGDHTVHGVTLPAAGELRYTSPTTVRYTPGPGSAGDAFTVLVRDSAGATAHMAVHLAAS